MREQQPADSPEYDDHLMTLVENALARAPEERESYLREAWPDDPKAFQDAWNYVLQEQRMNGFLLEPFLPPPPAQPLLEPGELLQKRFRIVRRIAQGGMGVVYEAHDEKLDRRIAIKCAKINFHERLPPEVRNASEISHPNVCKIFEIHTGSHSGVEFDFLTMEFLDGETLLERLRRGPVGSQEAKRIGRQLCDGLAEAHRNQVIHADLKTGNVILTEAADGGIRAVITDFGLASKRAKGPSEAETGQFAGTPSYMAPELLRGGTPSDTSDLFALGVILYEIAAGQKPWPSDVTWEDRLVQRAPEIPHQWNSILQRCLDPDPGLRPNGAAAVGGAIDPAASVRIPLAIAAVLAVISVIFGVWMYSYANAPEETVRLAILPFEGTAGTNDLAAALSSETSAELANLRGNARTEVVLIPASKARASGVDSPEKAKRHLQATHVIRARVAPENEMVVIQALLVDTNSLVNTKEWNGVYSRPESRYIPVAIAGLVTGAFHLPPLKKFDTVNEAALEDYQSGLSLLRRDSTIDAALPLLERAVAADPDSALTHAALAEGQWWKYWKTGDRSWKERATGSLRKAEHRNPELAAVHSMAGRSLAAEGWNERAKAEYLRAIELEPGNANAHRRIGKVYEQLNELDRALEAYRRAVELEPKNHRNHQDLGTYWYGRADYGQAIDHFRKTVELAPGEPEAHLALGNTYSMQGKLAESEGELRKALALGETPRVLISLGGIISNLGRDREAIRYYTRALELEPASYLTWMNLGLAYRRINMASDAARANRQALSLLDGQLKNNPKNGYDRACLAYVCAWLGDRARAQSEIAQALQFAPKDNNTRRMAVRTYEALKRREDTLAILRESPREVVAGASRDRDLADLHHDSRFRTVLASKTTRQETR